MAVSQEFVRRASAVLQEGVAAFLSNHLSKCAHAFQEALTKQIEMILVCNWLDLLEAEPLWLF